MSGRIIPIILGKRRGFPEIGLLLTFWPFMVSLGTVLSPVGMSYSWCVRKAYNEAQGIVEVDSPTVQFSHSVMFDSLRPHGLQHAKPPYHQLPEFTQTHVHWVSDAIQPSHPVIPFSSYFQSFPASGSFPMSQLFTLGGRSIGVSASTSILPMNTQDWSPLGWTGWISLQSKGISRVFSNTTV